MKKIAALSMAFVLLTLGFASAEQAQSDDDLVFFRGIAWGVPYREAVALLPEIKFWTLDHDHALTVESTMIGENSPFYDDVSMIVYGEPSDTMNVAGYEVSDIHLWFAFTPNEKGELEKNVENTALYMAQYSINVENVNDATYDLVPKLTALYGNMSAMVAVSPSSSLSNRYIWQVSNDRVWITLREQWSEHQVCILYGLIEGDEYLQNACDVLLMTERQNGGHGNTDGL